jgi:hypothetical protein
MSGINRDEEVVMEDDDYFEMDIDVDINLSKVDKNDLKALKMELDRIRRVIAHPSEYDCGFYLYYEFLAEHFGWKKMSREKLAIYHELTRGIPLEAVSADILDSIPFNQEELDNYWYTYTFVDYPLGLLILDAENNLKAARDLKIAKRLNLWREFFDKYPEELAKALKREEDSLRENPKRQPRLKKWFYDGTEGKSG